MDSKDEEIDQEEPPNDPHGQWSNTTQDWASNWANHGWKRDEEGKWYWRNEWQSKRVDPSRVRPSSSYERNLAERDYRKNKESRTAERKKLVEEERKMREEKPKDRSPEEARGSGNTMQGTQTPSASSSSDKKKIIWV